MLLTLGLIDCVGWDSPLRTATITGLLFIPRVNVMWEPWWWWWCRLGTTPDSSTRALCQSYQQRHLERVGGMDEGMRISRIHYLWYVNGYFTCRKILRPGTSGFTSHAKEGVLQILSPLNFHRHGQVWTREPWVQWQTLTTTPPRRHDTRILLLFYRTLQ
jgi:hypothetical protein